MASYISYLNSDFDAACLLSEYYLTYTSKLATTNSYPRISMASFMVLIFVMLHMHKLIGGD